MSRTLLSRKPPRRRAAVEALEGRRLLAVAFGAPVLVAQGIIDQVAVGDLNGDGKSDLVFSEAGPSPGIFVALSAGHGSFSRPAKVLSLPILPGYGGPVGEFALGDFLGDGKVDIALGGPGGTSIELLPGRGDGTFGTPIVVPVANVSGSISILAAADFNGDGRPDLLYYSSGVDPIAGGFSEGVALNLGGGRFTSDLIGDANNGYPPVVADFNGDGKADLGIVGPIPDRGFTYGNPGGIQFSLGDGRFTGVTPASTAGNLFAPYLAADFNGDGKPDVVEFGVATDPGTSGFTGPADVALNRGNGLFGQALPLVAQSPGLPAFFQALVAADFNGDGKLDLLGSGGAGPTSEFYLLAGNGDGTFQPPAPLRSIASSDVASLAVGDFNGDGRPDLVVLSTVPGQSTTQVSVLLNSPVIPPTISGHLDPASDTGSSPTDGITADTNPTFDGRATPGATVILYAQRHGFPGTTRIATTTAAADGSWRATSSYLYAGAYTITATATLNGQSETAQIMGGSAPLQIVSAPPEITSVRLDPLHGRLILAFATPGLGGLDRSLLNDPAALALSPGFGRNRPLAITAAILSAPAGPFGAQTLVATLNGGRRLGPGPYTLMIHAAGIHDVAGNALDGAFRGYFPSGDGHPGGDFLARFLVFRGRATRPIPVRYRR